MLTVLFIIITGCINRTAPKFSIDELPNATVGQVYSVVIGIWREFLEKEDLYWNITPVNSGFSMRCLNDKNSSCYGVELYGTPLVEGLVTIQIKSIHTRKNSSSISKTFVLKVNSSTEQTIKD